LLYTDNLEQKIFCTHQYINCDELIIISGYIGPNPIQRLSTLPINTNVIYGMYGSESISKKLHNTILNIHKTTNVNVLYSMIPVHSNCYVWKNNGEIIYALIGSANFSTNGLTIPFRETLAETTSDSFSELNGYLNRILSNSFSCDKIDNPPDLPVFRVTTSNTDEIICRMVLYDPRTGQVPLSSGLNWGNSLNGHTVPGDAYIPIRTNHIRSFPNLFPPKQINPTISTGGRSYRQNDSVELIWDDGVLMEALLEGTQPIDGGRYPKQLSSFPSKNILGVYIRSRLGLSPSDIVTMDHLIKYGRNDINISLLQAGTYFIDFSV
jgi:NgoFVII restriction endonuclease